MQFSHPDNPVDRRNFYNHVTIKGMETQRRQILQGTWIQVFLLQV